MMSWDLCGMRHSSEVLNELFLMLSVTISDLVLGISEDTAVTKIAPALSSQDSLPRRGRRHINN